MNKIRVTRKQYNRILLGYRISAFLVVLVVLIGYSLHLSRHIEFVLIFLPYFVSKGWYQKQYHSKSLKQCCLISIMVFAFAVTMVVPQNFSMCCSFAVGTSIAYGSSKIADINERLEKYDKLIEQKPFSVDNCTEKELLERCQELKLSEENTRLAVHFFVKKTKQSIIAEELCIDEHSVTVRKRRLKKQLNK